MAAAQQNGREMISAPEVQRDIAVVKQVKREVVDSLIHLDTLSGEETQQNCFTSLLEKGLCLKKRICSLWAQQILSFQNSLLKIISLFE